MTNISDDQVVAKLSSIGVPLDHFFLFSIERPARDEADEPGLIGFWHPEIGFRYLILENDDMARAAKRFLKRKGTRRFAPQEDVWETALREKWPGWDTCADTVRINQLAASRDLEDPSPVA